MKPNINFGSVGIIATFTKSAQKNKRTIIKEVTESVTLKQQTFIGDDDESIKKWSQTVPMNVRKKYKTLVDWNVDWVKIERVLGRCQHGGNKTIVGS